MLHSEEMVAEKLSNKLDVETALLGMLGEDWNHSLSSRNIITDLRRSLVSKQKMWEV